MEKSKIEDRLTEMNDDITKIWGRLVHYNNLITAAEENNKIIFNDLHKRLKQIEQKISSTEKD